MKDGVVVVIPKTVSYESPKKVARAYELQGTLRAGGKDLYFLADGGGVVSFEFGEFDADGWYALRKAAQGKVLRILVEILD